MTIRKSGKSPKKIEREYLEDRKKTINISWDEYLKNLKNENFDRQELCRRMEEMNSIDRMLTNLKARDLLG